MAEPGLIDYSIIGDLPDVYAKAQERAQKSAFEQSLKGFNGDYGDLVRRAAQAGYVPGIELASKLKQAEATNQYHLGTLAETKRQHDILAGQAMRPTIHWNPPDPFNPGAPPTGIMITHDKNGNIIDQRTITGGPGGAGAAPPPAAAPGGGGAGYWNSIPTRGLPGVGGLGARSEADQPGGPALAQAPSPFPVSPSDELITQAQQGGAPAASPGPQYAQSGGPPVPPPQPAPPPSWLAGAQAPGVALPQAPQQQQEAANPLSREQRGTLRYTPPLGPFNEEILANQPANVQGIVRGLVTGRVNPMSIPAKARPVAEGLAHLYSNGNYDQTFYQRRVRTLNSFAGNGQDGKTLTAINNLTDHLDTARNLISALENGQVPAINAAVNKFREVTGYKAELPGNLKAAAPIITGELLKVIAGVGGGGVGERAENELRLFGVNASPKVAYGAIDTAQKLMGGQIRGLEQKYENNTLNTDFRQKLSPTGREVMDKLDAAHAAPGAGNIDPRALQILRANPTPATRQYFKDTFKVDDATVDKMLQGP
jgi:hypothetical protein